MKSKSGKTSRNAPCPCGSGRKFKHCCCDAQRAIPESAAQRYARKYRIRLKTPADVAAIRSAGRLAVTTLDRVARELRPGMRTLEIDALVDAITREAGAVPAPLNYKGFPRSVCVSVNEEICHGIPGERRLEEGDIVNVDVTPILEGYYADANRTFFVGRPGPEARKIVQVARECLRRGIRAARPGRFTGDIGHAIQSHAESQGCSVVREFVGHGVGFAFHEAPQIMHYGRPGQGIALIPGMVFTIEPMINLGGRHLHLLDNGWTAVTDDGSLSAQFEQTVLITAEGCESLTPFPLEDGEPAGEG
jgi:methionyl aminopeptidase